VGVSNHVSVASRDKEHFFRVDFAHSYLSRPRYAGNGRNSDLVEENEDVLLYLTRWTLLERVAQD